MTTENDTILDLEALLTENLDATEEAPDFVTPPAGSYKLKISDAKLEQKVKKDGTPYVRVNLQYAVMQTIKLGDPKELPVPEGSLFSETFMWNDQGKPFFKKQVNKILNGADISGVGLKDLLEGLVNTEFNALITVRKTTDPNTGNVLENAQVRPIPAGE